MRATPSTVFREAMHERQSHHPFDRVSAYKVRESRNNLQRELDVVASIAKYQSARPSRRHSGMLRGCTAEDKASRLKRVPAIIARELGYNLIPAIEALTLEGVPAADIRIFIQSIQLQVDKLLADCDAVQMATARSIKFEYAALKTGGSRTLRLCTGAVHIAYEAVAFCKLQRVL